MTITAVGLLEAVERADKNCVHDYSSDDNTAKLADLVMGNAVILSLGLKLLENGGSKGMDNAVIDAINNANENRHKRPNMLTFIEEVNEAELSARGKHDDPLRLELMQVAGICINLMRRIDAGDVISLKTEDIVADALAQRKNL